MDRSFGIGEVARRTGLKPSALRYYESQGLVRPARQANGRRAYDAAAIDAVEVVVYARSIGFTLREVKTLFGAQGRAPLAERWKPLARAKIAELEGAIARARRIKRALEGGLACGCIRLEDCPPRR